MANLIIAVIGVAFAAALALAGVNYMSASVAVEQTEGSYITTETSQLLADYSSLTQNTGQTPSSTSYKAVYNNYSYNMPYSYGSGTPPTMTSQSKVPSTGTGWLFNPTCGGPGNTPCFCLTVDTSQSPSEAAPIYQAAMASAKKLLTSNGTSKIGLNASACSAAAPDYLQYTQWPASPPDQYNLVVVPYTPTPLNSCTCTQSGTTYLCGDSWTVPGVQTHACTGGSTGQETCPTSHLYTCASQGNIHNGGVTVGQCDFSQCVANGASCNTATEGIATPDQPNANQCTTGTYNPLPETLGPGTANWNWSCSADSGASVNCSSPAIVDGVCHPYPDPISTAPNPECDAGTGTPNPATAGPLDTNWHWVCNGINGGANPACIAPGICAGTPPNGGYWTFPTCTPTCPAPLVYVKSTNSCDCAGGDVTWGDNAPTGSCKAKLNQNVLLNQTTLTNNASGYNGTEKALCTTGGWTFSSQSCTAVATNTCGTPNPDQSAPWVDQYSSLCSGGGQYSCQGTGPSAPNWTWGWECTTGLNCTGTANNCSSPAIVDGSCGPDNGQTLTSAPWSDPNLCLGGAPNATLGTNESMPPNEYTWNCTSPSPNKGGQSGQCTACQTGYSWNGSTCVSGAQTCPSGSFWNGTSCVSGCIVAGETADPPACKNGELIPFGSTCGIQEGKCSPQPGGGQPLCTIEIDECVFDLTLNQPVFTDVGCIQGLGCGQNHIPAPYTCTGACTPP